MAQLIVAPQAQADLDNILDYLTREAGEPAACRYGDSFRAAFAFLTEFPRAGAPRPNFGATMRIKMVWPYVIFYRYSADKDIVCLIRILHGRRNITTKLFPPA
ncbi:MAG: type II toxin-antitoxin system RelE/ParE family toxin [bacterium]